MKLLKLLTFVLIISSSIAKATPTAEGLFRNVSNKEIGGNLIVITAQVSPMKMPIRENVLVQAPVPTAEGMNESPLYYKWLVSLEREKIIDVIQVTYSNAKMKEDSIISSRYLPDLKKIVAADSSLERSIFYGLLSVLSLNDSSIIGSVLTQYAQGYVSNKELMSREKLNLYYSYKNYLEKRQNDETLGSPLEPEDSDKADSVKETMAAPMYRDAGNVKLVRLDGELFWRVDLKNLQALFTNEGHRLKQIDYQSPLGDLQVIADEYVLFNGSHELPKTMIYKDMSQKNWKVQFTGLSHITNRNTPFTKRAQEYADAAKEANKKRKESTVPLTQPEMPKFIF